MIRFPVGKPFFIHVVFTTPAVKMVKIDVFLVLTVFRGGSPPFSFLPPAW